MRILIGDLSIRVPGWICFRAKTTPILKPIRKPDRSLQIVLVVIAPSFSAYLERSQA